MRTRIAELRWKEVVDVQNGSRFGYVEDLEVDLERWSLWCLSFSQWRSRDRPFSFSLYPDGR